MECVREKTHPWKNKPKIIGNIVHRTRNQLYRKTTLYQF